MALKSHDIERLRDLAKQVREISELPIQERTRNYGCPSMTLK